MDSRNIPQGSNSVDRWKVVAGRYGEENALVSTKCWDGQTADSASEWPSDLSQIAGGDELGPSHPSKGTLKRKRTWPGWWVGGLRTDRQIIGRRNG